MNSHAQYRPSDGILASAALTGGAIDFNEPEWNVDDLLVKGSVLPLMHYVLPATRHSVEGTINANTLMTVDPVESTGEYGAKFKAVILKCKGKHGFPDQLARTVEEVVREIKDPWIFQGNFFTPVILPMRSGFFAVSDDSKYAFVEFDNLKAATEPLERVINSIRENEHLPFAVKLANRLKSLVEAFIEETGLPSSLDSMQSFQEFMASGVPLKCPSITLTPSGEIYARWTEASGRVFSVCFINRSDARYVLFRTNPRHAGMTERITAATSVDQLQSHMKSFDVLSWIGE